MERLTYIFKRTQIDTAVGRIGLVWLSVAFLAIGLLTIGGTTLLLAQGHDSQVVTVCVGADGSLRLLDSRSEPGEDCKKNETMIELASGSLVNDVILLQQQVDANIAQFAGLTSDVQNMQDQSATNTAQVADIVALVGDLQAQTDSAVSTLAGIVDQVLALQGDTGVNANLLAVISSQVGALEGSSEATQLLLIAIAAQITELQGNVATNSSGIGFIGQQVAFLDSALTSLLAANNALNGQISDLNGLLMGLDSRVALLEANQGSPPTPTPTPTPPTNHIVNPGFEVAGKDLDGWERNESGMTSITNERDTSTARHGDASLHVAGTFASGGAARVMRRQDITAAAGDVWSFGLSFIQTSQSQSNKVTLIVEWLDSGNVRIGSPITAFSTAVSTPWGSGNVLTIENETAPSGTVTARIWVGVSVWFTGGFSGTADANIDNVIAVKAATLP